MKNICKSFMKRNLSILLGILLIGLLTMFGCAPTAEEALVEVDSYMAEDDLEQAETLLLEALQMEPDNSDLKIKMSEIYRQMAVNQNDVSVALECFSKAEEYNAEFEYTVDEITYLCNTALESNTMKKEVLEICNTIALEGKEGVSDELYVQLGISVAMEEESAITGKLLLDELYNISQDEAILQAWIKLDMGLQVDYQEYVEELTLCRTENDAVCSVIRFDMVDVAEGNYNGYDTYAYNQDGNVLYASRAFFPYGGDPNQTGLIKGLRYTYNDLGNLIYVESRDHSTLELFYDESNVLVSYSYNSTGKREPYGGVLEDEKYIVELEPGEQYLVEEEFINGMQLIHIVCEGKKIVYGKLFTVGNTIEIVKLSNEDDSTEYGFTGYANQEFQILERDTSGNVVYEIILEYDEYGLLKKETCIDYLLNTEETLYYVTEEYEDGRICMRAPVAINKISELGTYKISTVVGETTHASVYNKVEYDWYSSYRDGVDSQYEIYYFE